MIYYYIYITEYTIYFSAVHGIRYCEDCLLKKGNLITLAHRIMCILIAVYIKYPKKIENSFMFVSEK